MKNSNNGSKVSKLNNGVLSMKTKLEVNDLSYYSEEFAPGNSFGEQLSTSAMYANFDDQADDEDAAEISSMSTDQLTWLDYLEQQKDPAERLIKARSILNHNRYYTSDMSDELALLLLDQSEEDSEQDIDVKFVDKRSELVTVTLQKYGKGPFPYSLKEKSNSSNEQVNVINDCLNPEGKVKFFYSPEAIFDMENGQIVGLKMVENGTIICQRTNKEIVDFIPAITLEMQRLGYGYLVGGIGRIVLASSLFTNFAKLSHLTLDRKGELQVHDTLTEVPAPVYSGYNKVKGEVVNVFCDYAWAEPVEIADGIFILPASADTDFAKHDEVLHDAEIMYGRAEVTSAMIFADMFDDVRRKAANDDRNENRIENKAIIKAEAVKAVKKVKQDAKDAKYMDVVCSPIGQLAEKMIEQSYVSSLKVIQLAKDNVADLPAIMDAMFDIRKKTGHGCQYDVFKKIVEISEANLATEIKDVVQMIRDLNKNRIMVNELEDKQVVEILAVAKSQSTKLDRDLWIIMEARAKKINFKANVQAAKKIA